jgi:hypothetical protein
VLSEEKLAEPVEEAYPQPGSVLADDASTIVAWAQAEAAVVDAAIAVAAALASEGWPASLPRLLEEMRSAVAVLNALEAAMEVQRGA